MFNAGRLLALKELLKSIPTGPGWFSQASLESGDTNVLLRAIANNVGDWINSVYELRKGTYLNLATGVDLDAWGLDLGVLRKLAETDNNYRIRLQAEILGKKLTKPAIEERVLSDLGLATTVFLPWQSLAIYDNSYNDYTDGNGTNLLSGRSGTKRRSSSYYTAGVIDVQTEDFDVRTRYLVNKIKGAPIKPYFTPKLTGGGVVSPGTLIVGGDYLINYIAYVAPFVLTPIFVDYGQVRSGGPGHEPANMTRVFHLTNTTDGLQQRLFNDPNQANLDFRATSQTWYSVADLTWNELLAGHDRQVPAQLEEIS